MKNLLTYLFIFLLFILAYNLSDFLTFKFKTKQQKKEEEKINNMKKECQSNNSEIKNLCDEIKERGKENEH